ncbi:thermopsin precursor related protein, partial [mine drainage metagenome]
MNGENNTAVIGNNFVANGGASTNGSYSPSAPQVLLQNYQTGAFASIWVANYWSNWISTNGPYPVVGNITDTSPMPAFISTWLEINETGLPVAQSWGFVLDGVTYTTVAPLVYIPTFVLLPTGATSQTLAFSVVAPLGYTASPSSGSVNFTTADATVTIQFAPIPYSVSFVETGLPTGQQWSVSLGNQTGVNTGSTIAFTAYEGNYSFVVPVVGNYVASPASGTVDVHGASVTVDIAFSEPMYSVAFVQSTLPTGQTWSVTLDGTTTTSSSGQVLFTEPNGTYAYSIGAVAGYTVSPAVGTLTVSGPTTQP